MSNEYIFFLMTLCGLGFTLFAFRMGKAWLFAYVGVSIVLSNIFVTKQFMLFGIAATGGNVLYGSIFLATDLLSEHYGKKEARQAVLIGFFSAFFYLTMSHFIVLFNPNAFDTVSDGMKKIFSFAPRIIFASLTAYLLSQFHDIWAFHFIREKTANRLLWLRNNGSTWISQLIDSVVFCSIAFLGTMPFQVVLQIIISTYVLKILVAAIDTPFIYLSYRFRPANLAIANETLTGK